MPTESVPAASVTFTIGEQAIEMTELQDVPLDDKEWEALYADHGEKDLKIMHLGPYTYNCWLQALDKVYKSDPDMFKEKIVLCKYTCMPWRYFAALNTICERHLAHALAYFRMQQSQLETRKRKEAEEAEKREKRKRFDINDPNADPPSEEWVWTTEAHPGIGRGNTQHARCWQYVG